MVKFENINAIGENLVRRFRCNLKCRTCDYMIGGPNGRKCSRNVCVGIVDIDGANRCWQHARKPVDEGGHGLKIGNSGGDRGKGVFATQAFKKKDLIAVYTGDKLTQSQVDNRYGSGERMSAPYTFENDGGVRRFVDSACNRSVASTINDPRGTDRPANAVFKIWSPNENGGPYQIILVARKDINPGEEILAKYGRDYWRADPPEHSTKSGYWRNQNFAGGRTTHIQDIVV